MDRVNIKADDGNSLLMSRKGHTMLVDIQYVRPDQTSAQPDYLYIIWKDLDSGEKYLEAVNNPPVNIYFMKPSLRNYNYHKTEARIEDLYMVSTPYTDIVNTIVKEAPEPGAKEFIKDCKARGDYRAIERLKTNRFTFGHDYDIRTLYRNFWIREYDNNIPKHITKAFGDIEVDTMEVTGLPEGGHSPIDLVTVIDDEKQIVYTFCLIGVKCIPRDTSRMDAKKTQHEMKRRELYEHRLKEQEYWYTHQDELLKKAHNMFDDNYPGMEFEVFFFEDEREMLKALFERIHMIGADFLMFWNIAFDIPYILDRMQVLGMDPKYIIPHPDFPNKQCYFKKDRLHFQIKNKTDFFNVSDYTIYIDQMVTYAAMRKGASELRNSTLNYIAKREIGDSKLDYSDKGNIKTLSYTDWLMYYLYNIKDVLLQMGIEQKTHDIDTLYIYSYENLTQYENVFKQTVKLRNLQYKSWEDQGYIPGVNMNAFIHEEDKNDNGDDADDEDDSDSGESKDGVGYEGALVGNPLLNGKFGAMLYGKRANNIFQFSIDMDMSAFYPNTVSAMNIYPACLIFKMILDPTQYKCRGGKIPFHGITDVQVVKENKDSFKDDVAKEVMDNYITRNYISFARKWMNFPSVEQVYDEMKKLKKPKTSGRSTING